MAYTAGGARFTQKDHPWRGASQSRWQWPMGRRRRAGCPGAHGGAAPSAFAYRAIHRRPFVTRQAERQGARRSRRRARQRQPPPHRPRGPRPRRSGPPTAGEPGAASSWCGGGGGWRGPFLLRIWLGWVGVGVGAVLRWGREVFGTALSAAAPRAEGGGAAPHRTCDPARPAVARMRDCQAEPSHRLFLGRWRTHRVETVAPGVAYPRCWVSGMPGHHERR